MGKPAVALIGNGYLGQAYHEHMFPEAVVYDEPIIRKEAAEGHADERVEAARMVVNACDIAIIAVPTDYKEDGTLDTSIVEDVVGWLETDTILIKSALQPGTVDKLVAETGKNIAVSVELIGEGTYYQPPHKYPDPRNPKIHQMLVIGGEEPARSKAAEILWEQMSPDIRIHLVTALEAEITKMAENTYGALKVTWANVLRDICNEYGANFIQVHQAWSEDGRVDPMHTRSVEHNRGWNSKCYNKDVRAFAALSASKMLAGLVEDNERHLAMNQTQQMVGKREQTSKP
jgi:UDPglucose 6-dehydrogenase